uniref:Aspartate/glutamate leucyltransferase n=1 Tax=Magnetococcus massalia (strain MO-1) TaxID=451514 RepID=A0A1S7LNA1_MAGMO|nr:arginyl-tRNA--protein transferase [Candidatus Magnetococcus massalia]
MSELSRIDATAQRLDLLLTPPHACSYLADHEAAILFVEPSLPMSSELYEHLMERGFRRSSEHVYRPYCGHCDACVSVRIPVTKFEMSRSLRRVWKRNSDLEIIERAPCDDSEWFELYGRYLTSRHSGGPMDDPQPDQFLEFLNANWSDTRFVEFRKGGKLLMVAVLDDQPKSISAVYTFYDPDENARSLGTHAILWQIEEAKAKGREWVYLGYWIKQSPKMAYKTRFTPLEAYRNRRWRELTPEER